jgi:hypothetical protein
MIEDMKRDSAGYEAMQSLCSINAQDSGASLQCPTPPSDSSETLQGDQDDNSDMDMSEDDMEEVELRS